MKYVVKPDPTENSRSFEKYTSPPWMFICVVLICLNNSRESFRFQGFLKDGPRPRSTYLPNGSSMYHLAVSPLRDPGWLVPHPAPQVCRWLHWSPPLPLRTDPQLTPLTTGGKTLALCLGRSKVRSVLLVRVLNDGNISWVLRSQGNVKSFSTHDQSKATVTYVCSKNAKSLLVSPRPLWFELIYELKPRSARFLKNRAERSFFLLKSVGFKWGIPPAVRCFLQTILELKWCCAICISKRLIWQRVYYLTLSELLIGTNCVVVVTQYCSSNHFHHQSICRQNKKLQIKYFSD